MEPTISYHYVGKLASIDEEGDMAIRETLQRVLTDYQQAKTQALKDHPLAQFIGGEAESAITDALGELGQGLLVEGSPGRGVWVAVPWISVFDPAITLVAHSSLKPIMALAAVAITLLLPTITTTASAAELKLLSPQAMQPALSELVPQFERSSGHSVTISYASAAALTKRLETDESADVSILSPKQSEQLQEQGKIVAGSSIVIAKLGLGIIVRKSGPTLEISSIEALKRALLEASSIASGDPVTSSSGKYFAALVDRLGIAASLKPKIKIFPSGTAALNAIEKGEAEMVLEVMSAATGPGLRLAGPLPQEVQSFNFYAASIATTSMQVEAARALISFISSPAARSVMKTKGFDGP